MRLRVLAVGTRMPGWVQTAVDEYCKRLPRESRIDWVEIPPAKRQGGGRPEQFRAQEAELVRRHLKTGTHLLSLDVAGKAVSTEEIAGHLKDWQMQGERVALLIGGPDGIDAQLLRDSRYRWSLGRITMPHPLVRVVLAEQLYRAWSLNAGHPYHRA